MTTGIITYTPDAIALPTETDKHSKRYFSRRFREQLSGNWRLGPLVATARLVTAALLRKARGSRLLRVPLMLGECR